jgi:hypothetical protein
LLFRLETSVNSLPGISANRWGWQITVNSGASNVSTPIYAAAGNNVIANGTHVGNLVYSYDGSFVDVNIELFPAYNLEETHVYVGSTMLSDPAPGQYGNQHSSINNTSDSYHIAATGSPVYLVAHAVVCNAP